MPVLTEKQRTRIEEVIRDHHLAFRVEVLGPDSVKPEDLKRLKRKGILKLPKPPKGKKKPRRTRASVAIPAVHSVGALAAHTGDESIAKMSDETFWEYIKTAPPDVTPHEKEAIDAAHDKVGNLITGLGDKLIAEAGIVEHVEDAKLRRRMLMTVRREMAYGVAHKQSVESIALALQSKMKDLQHDWLMIAHTEMHNIFEEGKANAILLQLPPGSDPLVFKRPRDDSCAYCKILFLDGKVPRTFRLSELSASGTNHGRKARRPTLVGANATEWQATLGAVHPFCACSMHMLPKGFTFDDEGNMIYVGKK